MSSKEFNVSVILCVYNGQKFLRKAIESAILIDEVKELIIVDDGSTDSSLLICKELQKFNSKIKIFLHKNKQNLGLASSRNLGIKMASCEYIAFLDADDFYLPHRFTIDSIIFSKFLKADAVYSCSIHFDNSSMKDIRIHGATFDPRYLLGEDCEPLKLYLYKLKFHWELFNNLTITLKKEFLIKNKLFDNRLKLHQDIELWNRLLRCGHFYAGNISNPVAMIRKHDLNASSLTSKKSMLKMIGVYLSNVNIHNLNDFEKTYWLKFTLRIKTKYIRNNIIRRMLYYFYLFFWSFNKSVFLKKIENEYS